MGDTEMKKAKDALTRVKVLASNSTFSLLEVETDTGRYHQIRVHLAHAGYPLVGDTEYCYTVRTMASGAQVQAFSPSSTGGRKMGGLWSNKYKRTMLHSFSMFTFLLRYFLASCLRGAASELKSGMNFA